MDPSLYYAHQAASSHPHPQHQDNDRANQMQVSQANNQVQQYLNELYRDPMRAKPGLSNDPAFYTTAQQNLLNAKHRLEQMLLVNQQNAELSQMATQIQYAPSIYPQHVAYMNAQRAIQQQPSAWPGPASGAWTYQQQPAHQQQAYPQQANGQPMTHPYTGQFGPDATVHDATYQQAHSVPQIVQLDSPQQHSGPSRPPQSQPRPTHETPLSVQQPAVSLPNVEVQPQLQPLPQATPSTSTSHPQHVHQPQSQPQPHPQRPAHSQSHQPTHYQGNPLQPAPQPDQASSSTAQKGRETAQKQLNYLQVLAQQHQRKQQTRPSSHQSSPASPQVALPSVPPVPSGSILLQPVPQLAPVERSSPPQESIGPASQAENPDTVNPSPARIRSRKPFALHDLRSERRKSAASSNGSNTPAREMISPNIEGANASSGEITAATPTKGAKPADNPSHGLSLAEPGPSQKRPTQTTSGPVSPGDLSGVASPLVRPEQIADGPASVPVGTTNLVSEKPNASTPALNKPAQLVPPPSTPINAQKQSGGGGSKMKIALENLHMRGVDCVALVREAAHIAGVSINNLAEETGPVNPSLPLFTPGQPLDVWTSNLQVTRVQGDNVVKSIWDLMKKKAREIGIDAEVLKHPPPKATTNKASAEGDRVTNYSNPIPPSDEVQVVPSSSNPTEDGTSQPVAITKEPHVPPGAANVATEPQPPSTQPPMQTPIVPQPAPQAVPQTAPQTVPQATPQVVPPAQTAPARLPEPPAPAPAPPSQAVQPAPTHQAPNAAPSIQPDPAVLVAQLAQRHQYNPYPNGAPPVRPVPQVHTPAYVPPNLATQSQVPAQAIQFQGALRVQQWQPQPRPAAEPAPVPEPEPERSKTKPRKTAALDYLRSLGVDISDGGKSDGANSSPSKPTAIESEPIQTKDKGKGKATDVEGPAAPVQPEPSNNGNTAPEPAPLANVAGPSRAIERPPSPAAPIIAVLPEPSPTPPSPLSMVETITRPITPVSLAPVAALAPTPVEPSMPTIDSMDALSDTIPPPVSAATPPLQMQSPHPAPEPVENPPSPTQVAPTTNADPAPPIASPPSALLSPPVASISALTLNNQSSPAEPTPLKRKRESRPSDVIEAGPGPKTEERARLHAANKHDQKRPKVTKRRDSTTTGVGKNQSSYPGSPYPNIPRPDDPLPKNNWAHSYVTAMNAVNRTDRPLFRPETPPPSPPKSKPTKRRMIMEVVIPLRKKGKATAADLTLSDAGTEWDDDLGLDKLVQDIHEDTRTEQEPDLKMLRRRLRPHTCEWIGCIGPPVLASVELLGVHLNRHHLNCKDPDTVSPLFISSRIRLDDPPTALLHVSLGKLHASVQESKTVMEPHFGKTRSAPLVLPIPRQVTTPSDAISLNQLNLDCDRTTSERYRMIVHVNRAHRGNADAKLRVFAQPEDFPPDRADPEEGVMLRPDAFPDGVPYFRIMGMALRYEVVPAQIPPQRHARIGPIILRDISAPAGFVSVPRQVAGSRVPELPLPPVLASPMPSRSQVRLGTVPPDALGQELEREAGPPPNKSPFRRVTTANGTKIAEPSGKARGNPSPARSHITITSDESSPEPENRRGNIIRGRGRGRGRGGTSIARADRSMASQSSQLSAPPKTPRLQVVVELPRRGSGGSSTRK